MPRLPQGPRRRASSRCSCSRLRSRARSEREAARTARAAKARYWTDAYAHRGYPAWVAANPERACPARLAELDAYVGRRDTLDPWGTTYQFLCGRQHGVVGLRVRSAGPDRQFDTHDDIGIY